MSALRVLSPLVLLLLTGNALFADEPIWTETFADGVGRLNITTGHAEDVFVHDPFDQNVNATFIRREADLDRRLADLGGVVTQEHVAAFSMIWTPRQTGSTGQAWPSLGFFDSATNSHVAGIKVRNAGDSGHNWGFLIPGLGDPGVPGAPQWNWEQTYLIGFEIDGPGRTVHFSSAILVDGEFVPEFDGGMSFPDSVEYAFDTVGIGNIVDPDAPGATFVADVDDFSLLGLDCNGNEVLDFFDIENEESNDNNSNGIPDECECPADFDFDGTIGAFDLAVLLGSWGPCPEPPADCPADIHGEGDGIVQADDLAALLGSWGPCP